MSLLFILRRLSADSVVAPVVYKYGFVTVGSRHSQPSTVGQITDPGSVLIER